MKRITKNKKGFTLLLAVLISSLLLAIGLAIFNITIKELLLASSGRESQFAFYSADTGTECALYWDLKQGAFSTSTTSSINCNGTAIPGMGGGGYGAQNVFQLDFSPEPYCAIVTVTKTTGPERTTIESRGYNSCDTGNPRRVERAIRVVY
jgi:hypothetical protein|tara:strand:+ start:40802 stop:41254 length:453 start_codon:yes stop_codon:yes gene_type:complete